MTAFSIDQVLSSAQKELQSFLGAVAEVFGSGKVEQAACLWIEAVENAAETDDNPESFFHRITIQVASQMAAAAHSSGDTTR